MTDLYGWCSCDHSNLLGSVAPLIVRVVALESAAARKRSSDGDSRLLESAVLALCKFMCVSSEFCNKHLQLLFKVVEDAKDPGMRATISIALGDLAFRFPNILEPWTAKLYAGLRDEDARVRKNTLMVLTHLVLNDMVKIKGQLSEIAVCLEDPDSRVKDLTKMFFSELSKRGGCHDVLSIVVVGLFGLNACVCVSRFDFRQQPHLQLVAGRAELLVQE